ncbi:MAG: WcaI family glycosyltransferase [Deltaproteobacteria bacterium]|nr:WcaI family glycosyltransferase [Deltaproteobacteria bacterium]
MRCLILGLNYLPETTSIGPYTADLAEHLQRQGHMVQVVTGFPVAPYFRIWEGYRGRMYMGERVNGVDVLRTYLYVPERPGRARNRALFDSSFALSSMIGGLVSRPIDVVVAISPPLQLGLTAWVLARIRRAKVFLQIKDLVPDAAIAAGMLTAGSRAARLGYVLERAVCRRVDRVGVICEGFKTNLVNKGVPAGKIDFVPDYIDLGFMLPAERVNGFRTRHNLAPGDFVVTYSGSIALKQGLRVFVETAAQMASDRDVKFMLIGDGPYLADLQNAAQAMATRNLSFLPLQPRETLPSQLGAADVLVITQRKAVKDCVFPGKLLYYMAAGRPILAAVSENSEAGSFINRHRVGLVVAPEDPQALASGVRTLRAQPQLAREMGEAGRAMAERMFNRDVVLKKFECILTELAS